MVASRLSLKVIVLTVMSSIWLETCCVLSQAPLYQNITIATLRLSSNIATDTNRGRVDIQVVTGAWGSICPARWNDSITSSNVNTTCAMLGFRNGGKRIAATFGPGNKNFLIENATCPVNAVSWSQCTQYFAKTCGPQDEELAIECFPDINGVNYIQFLPVSAIPGSGGNPAVIPVINVTILNGTTTSSCTPNQNTRLFGGSLINSSIGNGYVQVNVNNQWWFVCGDFWNQAAAKVACKELCYNMDSFDALPGIIAHSVPDPTNKAILLNSFNCKGNESRLQDCPIVNTTAVCQPNTVLAGVQCKPECCAGRTLIAPDVNCSSEVLVANFSRFPLVTANNIFLINNVPRQCMNVSSTSSGVVARLSVASICGADLRENTTHITYTIPIRYLWVSDGNVINSYANVRYDLVCSVGKAYSVTNRLEPYTLAPNLTIYQQYNYSLSMDLYTNCNFTELCTPVGTVFMMEVGQWLVAAVSIDNYDNRTKLIITDCDAYPVMPYVPYAPVVKLIQDKCPVDTTLTIYSLDNRREGFQVRAFMFAGYSMSYIRCSVNVCLLDSTSPECDRACNKPTTGRRKKRQVMRYSSSSIDTGTILIYDSKDAGIAKLLEASGQKSQQGNEAGQQPPETIPAAADNPTSSTIKQTTRQQTTDSAKQQPSLTSTYTPSSTTTKLQQLLTKGPEESDKQTAPTTTIETTTKTSASATTSTTPLSKIWKNPEAQEVMDPTQSTKSTKTNEQQSLVDATTTTKIKETIITQNPQDSSTRPYESSQHPKMISTTLRKNQETVNPTSQKTTGINTATIPTKTQNNEQADVSGQQEIDEAIEEKDTNIKENQRVMSGQNGVDSESTEDNGNRAIVRHFSGVAGTIVLLHTLSSLLL